MKTITIPTTPLAGRIIRYQYGDEVKLNARKDRALFRVLTDIEAGKSLTRQFMMNDEIIIMMNNKYFSKLTGHEILIGGLLNEHYMHLMNISILAKVEEGISISSAIRSFCLKYEIDDDILDRETIVKSFYRFRQSDKNFVKNSSFYKNTLPNRRNRIEEMRIYVLDCFKQIDAKKTQILKAVCAYYSINENILKGTRQKGEVVFIKKVLVYLYRELLGMSFERVAIYMGCTKGAAFYLYNSISLDDYKSLTDIYSILQKLDK